MSAFFYKELPDRPAVINGHVFKFDFLKVDDEPTATLLRNAAKARIGGIVELNESEYESRVKKKLSSPSLKKPSTQRQEVKAGMLKPRKSLGRAVAAAQDPSVAPAQADVPRNERGLPDFTAYLPKTGKAGGDF